MIQKQAYFRISYTVSIYEMVFPSPHITLDLVVTAVISALAADFIQSKLISGDFAVSLIISILTSKLDTERVTCRKLNQIDH